MGVNILKWLVGGGSKNIVDAVKDVADEFITTEEERLEYELKKKELELKEKEIDTEVIKKIHETNIQEAKHPNWFVAGWRPFIGWVAGIALLYIYVIAPFFHSIAKAMGKEFPLPEVDIGLLVNLILGMLGLAWMRTLEKKWKVQDRH